jgi:hypothetical protein
MAFEFDSQPEEQLRSRHWAALIVLAVILVAALAAFAMRRGGDASTVGDCETKPPPNTFAIAECDDGAAPAGAHPDAPAAGQAPAAR